MSVTLRTKPVEIEAYRVGSDAPRPDWLQALFDEERAFGEDVVEIPTIWGFVARAEPGDYITRDESGAPFILRAAAVRLLFEAV